MIVGITGGTGFIGRNVALRHLARGDRVRVLSRRPVTGFGMQDSVQSCLGDVTDQSTLRSFVDGVDVLYHCAGEIRDTSQMEAVHVDGTRNLLAAADGKINHWVQLSSVGVYGPVSAGLITEQTGLNPVGPYEITKLISDQLVIAAANSGSFSYSILRPSNVFSGEMKNQSLFGLMRMIDKGMFFFIGKPGASANYIYVDNVVDALLLCGTAPTAKGRIYNLSDYCSLEEFVTTIASLLGKKIPTLRAAEPLARILVNTFGKIPAFPLTQSRIDALTNRSIYSISCIQQELGYEHRISMEEGLQHLVTAYGNRK